MYVPAINSENCTIFSINPFKKIPNEVFSKIILHTDFNTFGRIAKVSHKWNRITSDPVLRKRMVHRFKTITKKHWKLIFGKKFINCESKRTEMGSLPSDIYDKILMACPICPAYRIMDTHLLIRIPKSVYGNPLTLRNFIEILKFHFPNHTGYKYFWHPVVEEIGDREIEKSYWVLITKDVIPASKSCNYAEQEIIVAELAKKSFIDYEISETLQTVVGVMMHKLLTNERLFSDSEWTYNRCVESLEGHQIMSGGFSEHGLRVIDDRHYLNDCIGVAPICKIS